MFDFTKARLRHGNQAIPDPLVAQTDPAFPGYPELNPANTADWEQARLICPTRAIGKGTLDLGRCVFCGLCQRRFPDTFRFSNSFRIGAGSREALVLDGRMTPEAYADWAINPDPDLKKLFGQSIKLRSVSAAGCNACEMELNASTNVNFDINRYGVDIVASPRHADGVIVTGPVSRNMAYALRDTWEAVPSPKILILAGTCAISGGLFEDAPDLDRDFLRSVPATLYLPGCPVHPLTIIHGITRLIGRLR